MEEEVEIFELDEMKLEQSSSQIINSLSKKLMEGFKVSIMVRKIFKMPIPSSKKNNLFSKRTEEIFVQQAYDISDSFTSEGKSQEKQDISPKHQQTASSLQQNDDVGSLQQQNQEETSPLIESVNKSVQKQASLVEENQNQLVDVSVQVSPSFCAQVQHQEIPNLPSLKPDDLSPFQKVAIAKRLAVQANQNRNESQQFVSQSSQSKLDPLIQSSSRLNIPSGQRSTLQDPPSPSSSSSSVVNFFVTKDDSFYQALRTLRQYQQIQSALLYLQDGIYSQANSHMLQAYNESYDCLQKGQLDKTQQKLYSSIAVQALCYLGQISRCQGNFDEANRYYEKCLRLFEINDFDILGKIYIECGVNAIQSYKLLKGLDYYHKALAAYEKANWKLDIARVLNYIAHVYGILGEHFFSMIGAHEDAKKMCYEALAIYKSKLVDTDIRISETYHILGYIFYQQKDYECAMDYLKQSLENKQKLYLSQNYNRYGDKHISLVKTYNLMGIIQHLIEEPNHAIEYYEQAVWIYGGETQLGLSQILNNLGLAYIDRMKVKSAKLSFEKASEILLEFYDVQHPQMIKVMQNKLLVQKSMVPT